MRRRVLMGARVSSGPTSKQDYRTPTEFMTAVEARFGPITFDLAATAANTQSPNYFAPCSGPEGPMPFDPQAFATDAFDHPWATLSSRFRREGFLGLCWLNCEFNDIEHWASKCAEESQKWGCNILLLTPASVGANWFSDVIAPFADVYIVKPRLAFIPKQTYNKDCMLSHFCATDVRSSDKFAVKGAPSEEFRSMEIWNWKLNKTEHQWIRPNFFTRGGGQ